MSVLRTRVLAAIAGLLALAVLALWLLRAGPLPPERAANPPAPLALPMAQGVPASPPRPVATRAPASEAPPPWSAAPSTGSALPAATAARRPATPADTRSAQLLAIQRQLVELSASGQAVDVQKVDHLLGEIERVQGSSTIGGVKIDVLRHNLAIAQQMRVLATDIQQLSSRGAQADPKQLQAQMARIVELQAQMRTDVVVAPAAVPAPAGR